MIAARSSLSSRRSLTGRSSTPRPSISRRRPGEARWVLVHDRRDQGGVGDAQRCGDVRGRARAARRDHRDGHGVTNAPRQLEVVAQHAGRRDESR